MSDTGKIVSFILGFFVLIIPAWGVSPSLDLELRHASLPTLENTLDQTLTVNSPLNAWMFLQGGMRVTESAWVLEALEYKAELELAPVSFLSLHLRLAHNSLIGDGAGSSCATLWTKAEASFFSKIKLFVLVGLYQRRSALNQSPLLPVTSPSLSDRDFALGLGASYLFRDRWEFSAKLATFDNIHTFNLNNPFAELRLAFQPQPSGFSVHTFARYKILLGFGRLDEFLMGAGISLPLDVSPPLSFDSRPGPETR